MLFILCFRICKLSVTVSTILHDDFLPSVQMRAVWHDMTWAATWTLRIWKNPLSVITRRQRRVSPKMTSYMTSPMTCHSKTFRRHRRKLLNSSTLLVVDMLIGECICVMYTIIPRRVSLSRIKEQRMHFLWVELLACRAFVQPRILYRPIIECFVYYSSLHEQFNTKFITFPPVVSRL